MYIIVVIANKVKPVWLQLIILSPKK